MASQGLCWWARSCGAWIRRCHQLDVVADAIGGRKMTEKISAAEINLDELLRWYEEHQAKKEWDKEHTYLIDIIKILHGRKWGVRKVDLDGTVYEKRFTDGEPMPKKFSETIQSVLNNY